MKRVLLLSVLLIAGGLLVGGGYFFLFNKDDAEPAKRLPPFTAEGLSDQTRDAARFLREQGQEGLRQRQLLPLVRVYEGLLEKYPDNGDLRKKLAELYVQTGQPEKAEALKQKAPSP